MIIYSFTCLFFITIYSWTLLHKFGYHGVFSSILISLWLLIYWSLWELYKLWRGGYFYEIELFNWSEIGNQISNDFNFTIDFLSLILVLIMGGGSLTVVCFVYFEMWEDKEGANFVIALIVFLAFMIILVSSCNFLIFYLGWEGIGLTSLFLINFWIERIRSFKAAFKVFTINKIGDFLVTLSICGIIGSAGAVDFSFLYGFSSILTGWLYFLGEYIVSFIDFFIIIIIIGGGVKSSQYGFHIWLLEAMEAPLGASALMHSSTLVIAGIILVFRLGTMVQLSSTGINCLLIWGCWTAGFGACIACFQYELKIILAYSTISSMGFIYCLLGMNAITEGLLYLIIHAFTKIFLFLVVGLIMFYCLGCQDIRWSGGLLMVIPAVWLFFISGSVVMAGLPYWGGYYYKTKLLIATFYNNFSWHGIRFIIFITTFTTYIYLCRLLFITFMTSRRGHFVIYSTKWVSFLIFITFTLFSLIVLFSGILWEQILLVVKNLYIEGWEFILSPLFVWGGLMNSCGWEYIIFIYIIVSFVFLGIWYYGINKNYVCLKKWLTGFSSFIFIITFWNI